LSNPTPENSGGVPIVLTGSAIDMSNYNLNPFRAFIGGFPSRIVPRAFLRRFFYPPVPTNGNGTARYAPYGMRKIEAVLMGEFGEENVAVVHPKDLDRVVGPRTKAIGISCMEPAGTGFVSRTYTSLVGIGGAALAVAEFRDLVRNPLLRRWGAKVILGGSGAWQVHRAGLQEDHGIDCIVMGEGERTAREVFRKALGGGELPPVVESEAPKPLEIPPIANASIFGTVEITRGCGRGCKFCSPTMRRRYSFPMERILQEVELNAREGTGMIALASDDIFLYKCKKDFIPDREAIVTLVKSVAAVPGVRYIQPAHASLAPVVHDPGMIEEIGPILLEKSNWHLADGTRFCSAEVGLETGSVRLMREYMKNKMLPYEPEEWQDVVTKGIEIMNQNGIWPLATLITGLPGEEEDDTQQTLVLLDQLKNNKVLYVPLLFTSEEECMLKEAEHMDMSHLTPSQWDVMATCWERNIRDFYPKDSVWKIRAAATFARIWPFATGDNLPLLSRICRFQPT
jgi:radical SAM superfamily enzyme YgiQ (UPF0313 family)